MITLTVNGESHTLDEWSETPLLWVLQVKLGYFEDTLPCGIDNCGMCTVLVDGKPMRACKLPLTSVAGKEIVIP